MRRHALALGFFGAAALTPLVIHDGFFLDSLILILMWGAVSGAWNVAGGYAGQVSLGHSAFFGIGAYSAALMATRLHASPWLGMLAGAVVATAAGLVIGYLSNRLKGPYFALATIAFSQVLLIVASRWRAFTAGSEGVPVPFRPCRLASRSAASSCRLLPSRWRRWAGAPRPSLRASSSC